jgi:hypothetical protein
MVYEYCLEMSTFDMNELTWPMINFNSQDLRWLYPEIVVIPTMLKQTRETYYIYILFAFWFFLNLYTRSEQIPANHITNVCICWNRGGHQNT